MKLPDNRPPTPWGRKPTWEDWLTLWLPYLTLIGGIIWMTWMIVGIILWFFGIEIPLPVS